MALDDELDRLLQLEAAKWRSAVTEIEELLGGFQTLGETLEDQAVRLADSDGRGAFQLAGRSELEQGQEAMIRARLKGKSRGDKKVSKKDTVAQLRAELASIGDNEAEELELARHEMLSAMGASSCRDLQTRGSTSSLGSVFGGTPSPGGVLANTSSSFSSVDVVSAASTLYGGNPLSAVTPTVPPTPRTGGSDGMSSTKKFSQAMQSVRTGIRMQSAARAILSSNPLATPRSATRSDL